MKEVSANLTVVCHIFMNVWIAFRYLISKHRVLPWQVTDSIKIEFWFISFVRYVVFFLIL